MNVLISFYLIDYIEIKHFTQNSQNGQIVTMPLKHRTHRYLVELSI